MSLSTIFNISSNLSNLSIFSYPQVGLAVYLYKVYTKCMNTSHKGVKAIFLAILLALTVSFSVTPRAEAQTFSAEQQATLDQLNQTLITLLTELIAQLQEQIATLIAEQATQATQLGAVQTQVDTVVEQTKPVVGAQPQSATLSFGTPYCDSNDVSKEEVSIPITVQNATNGSVKW